MDEIKHISWFNDGCSWSVAERLSNNRVAMIKGEVDSPNRAGAVAIAQRLAKQFPNKTFLVMGPSDEVSAVIPVDVKEWKDD